MGAQGSKLRDITPLPALSVASASLPHQGRFAPLRGAREERASLTRQPVRHLVELQGRDEEQGFYGPNKEHGEREGRGLARG